MKVINLDLENQKHPSILIGVKRNISIDKIKTNSHEVHIETKVPKKLWVKRICHHCNTKRIEDEKHFLLECPMYAHIRSQFQDICYNRDLPNLLLNQNYDNLGMTKIKI